MGSQRVGHDCRDLAAVAAASFSCHIQKVSRRPDAEKSYCFQSEQPIFIKSALHRVTLNIISRLKVL